MTVKLLSRLWRTMSDVSPHLSMFDRFATAVAAFTPRPWLSPCVCC